MIQLHFSHVDTQGPEEIPSTPLSDVPAREIHVFFKHFNLWQRINYVLLNSWWVLKHRREDLPLFLAMFFLFHAFRRRISVGGVSAYLDSALQSTCTIAYSLASFSHLTAQMTLPFSELLSAMFIKTLYKLFMVAPCAEKRDNRSTSVLGSLIGQCFPWFITATQLYTVPL